MTETGLGRGKGIHDGAVGNYDRPGRKGKISEFDACRSTRKASVTIHRSVWPSMKCKSMESVRSATRAGVVVAVRRARNDRQGRICTDVRSL